MGSVTEKSMHAVAEAIATADEMPSHPFSPLSSQVAKFKQSPIDVLSLEDAVWADSCLEDPDASHIDWNSWDAFSLALNGILSSETSAAAARIENHMEGAVSREQIGSAKILVTRADGYSSITEAADENSEDQLINEQADLFLSEINLENVLLSTWNENLEKFSAPDIEESVEIPDFVMEQSTRDIFKVWDLGLPAEEDEFISELNKALAQSSLEQSPSVSNDSEMLKGLKDTAISDIISGISNLSLNHFPM